MIYCLKREKEIERRNSVSRQRQSLVDSLGIQNVQDEIKKSEDIIISKWNKSKSFFERISAEHSAYQNKLKKTIKELSEEKNNLQKRLEPIKIELGIFKEEIKKHKESFNELLKIFDAFRLAVPEYLLDDINNELEKLKETWKKHRNGFTVMRRRKES